jgi:hypothetical protein
MALSHMTRVSSGNDGRAVQKMGGLSQLRKVSDMQMTVRLGSMAFGALFPFILNCSSDAAKNGGASGAATAGTSTGGTAAGGAGAGGGGAGGAGTGGAGTGGAGTGGASGASGAGAAGAPDGSTGRPTELPASDSQADISAFVERSGYKGSSWISETAMPRDGTFGTQHGGKVRVWENAPLVASLKGGRDGRMGNPYPDQWSMAVKEFYDVMSGDLVGAAVAFKTAAGADFGAWTYYCYGPDNRCSSSGTSTKEMPVYGKGSSPPGSNCGFCHGFSIFTIPP